MDVLHCKNKAEVEKELWMFLLIHNLVRAAMLKAAQRQKGGGGPNQFRQRVALDAVCPRRRSAGAAGDRAAPSEPDGAACAQAAGQGL